LLPGGLFPSSYDTSYRIIIIHDVMGYDVMAWLMGGALF